MEGNFIPSVMHRREGIWQETAQGKGKRVHQY